MKALTNKQYIDKIVKVHGDTYVYNKIEYKNSTTKIIVICKEHGEFETNPRNFLKGNGCPKCSGKGLTTEDWIKRFNEIHKNKYDYSKFIYTSIYAKSIITCTVHGDFEQNPNNHRNGQGCPKCAIKTAWKNNSYYNVTNAEKNKEEWRTIPCSLYIVKMYSEDESFFKIGIASSIKERFRKFKKYSVELIECFSLNRYDAILLESALHLKYKEYKYTPTKPFKGYSECFSTLAKNENISLTVS